MAKDEIPIEPQTLGAISHENFFLFTRATYVECEGPEDEPDYVSTGGSCYWHRSDEKGDYVIRKSNHWCQYYFGKRTIKRLRARIRSCSWHIIIKSPLEDVEIVRFGICYLSEFDRIIWRSKRRYELINERVVDNYY